VDIIFENIERILVRNDHAVIPGFGAFVIQHQQAHISNNSIIPSGSTISFNPLINNNDGMLIVEIARQKNISYKQAANLAKKEINSIVTTLNTRKVLRFGRLGIFTKGFHSDINFSPAKNLNFLPENLGLDTIPLPIKLSNSKNQDFNFSVKKFTQYAAVIITFIALFLSTGINKTPHMVTADFSHLYHYNLPEITVNDSQITAQAPEIETIATSSGHYKVIIAAFYTEAKAFKVRNQFITENFADTEVITSNGISRISICSFSDFDSAVKYMEDIRIADKRFADAWVFNAQTTSQK